MPLHPLVVHFPIALLFAAGVLYVIYTFSRKEEFARFAFYLHAAGLAGIVLAIVTGDYEESELVQTEAIHDLVGLHENLGMLTGWAFAMMMIWAFLRKGSKVMWEKLAFCLVFLGLLGVLSYSAHLGGELVYENGAGVKPMKPLIEQIRQEEQRK